MDRPKVIYIMGCGRSGTTILDILLGNHSGFFSVGEINNFFYAWNTKSFCSCGSRLITCEIWKNIGKKYFSTYSEYNPIKMNNYQFKMERNRFILKQVMGLYNNDNHLKYKLFTYNIFKDLQEMSYCKTMIDSSKSAGRAMALLKNEKLDVKIIHIIRDPRGVFYSFQKKIVGTPVKNILSVAMYWNTNNILAELIKITSKKKFIRIRYEDLVTVPNKTINYIEKFIDESLDDLKEKIAKELPLERLHLPSGNRIRSQSSILKLSPDFTWKKNLNFYQKSIFTFLCFPWLSTYGYSKY